MKSKCVEIECVSARHVGGGAALIGFADVRIAECRMRLVGYGVFSSKGRRWVNVAAKKDSSGGYTAIVIFDSPELQRDFSDAAIDAVLAFDLAFFEDCL
ncbi:hypothetical protein HFO09_08285 [Rhizobium laguerreae]|uniref:Uncharacterized protein n=1 Tax=Rhizobium leguminosarum TaxID=384 RepID=A0A6P0DMG8_RHILE|nr:MULTISPECIES: hypothetical protein [Rhizobium]MBY3255687.1 hypothetical protein [Rhizobium laguerreae]MBY3282726.1 hypothetical protein [Rhizobium laguerreae]MBY3289080.1 hypothetical protein [Rhizobium laguerreae]NEK53233.1 hypothetical protein [Rhizobium leguminosarum]